MPTFLGPDTQAHSEKQTILPLTYARPTSPPGYLRWLSSRVPSSRAKERLHGSTFASSELVVDERSRMPSPSQWTAGQATVSRTKAKHPSYKVMCLEIECFP